MKKLEKTTKEKLLKENQELKAEISRLKKAEEALKESEEKFRFIEENLQEGLWITDKKDLMVYFNKAMEGISGAKSKDVLGLNVLKDFPKETIQYFKNYYLKAKKTLIPTQYEADVIAPNGRKTIQKGWLIPRINNEVFSGMVCTIEDITEHKQAQEALVASLQLSEDLFRASFSGIYVYEYQEPDRLILVDANAMAEKMTGVKLCDWKGREFNEIWPQARKDGWTDTYLEVVRSGKTVERDNIVYEDERVSVAIQAKIFQLPNQKVAVSFEDITKRTQAEEAIKESEEKYRALFERESDAIFLHDPVDTKIIIANKATSKLYGYDNDELIGMSCLEFSTEVEKSVSAMKAVQKSGDVVIPVRYHKKKDGTVFPVDISGYKIILGGKELIFAVCKDITQRVKAEEALKKSKSMLASAQKIGLIGTWNLDIVNDVLEWTEECYRIFGIKQRTPMNLDGFLEMVHPDDRDYVAKKWTAGINGEEYDIEHRLLIKGKVKWVREKADITFDENGKAIRAVGITQDITEKKNAEETLKESEERWRSLTQYSASHIIILDLDYKIQFINHTVPDLTIDQIIGRLNMDFVPPDFHQVAVDCFDRVVKNKNPDQYETLYVTTEGEMQYFEARISPMFDKDGNVNGLISTANNITERKRVEVALKKSEEKFRKLFESSKDALMTLAPPTWKFASGNPSIIEMFGVADEKEFTSLGPWDLSPKYQPDGQLSSVKAKKMIAKAMKTGYNFFEWTHCKFKGEDFYATVLLTWVDLGGEKFLQATVRDISEQKQAKEELIESELLLSESQDLAKIGSWKLNTKTFEVNWSNEMYSIFGFKRSGQDNLLEFGAKQIHPDDRNRAWKDSKEAVEARKPYEIEYRIIQPNGNIRSVINKGQPKFNARGEVEFYIGFIQDITEQKRAEKAIMESNSLLSSIIESPNNVIMFAIDRSYNYIGFNNAHKKEMKLVFDADIEIGQPIFSYVDNENDRLKSKKNFEHVLEGERFTVIEQYGILENRSWYELIFNPIIDESKNVTGFTVYVANITDRKLAEEELIKAKEKAEEADHLKSAFLANMSHEIRTPMNGILGFLGLLKEPNLTDDKKDNYIRIVNKGGERLLNTINDIIEISKIESDNIEIENKRIEIKNLLTYYYDFFLPQTKSKQLSFNLVGANKMENVILYTDKNKLDSILTNLLKNAIKFTTGGKIEFGCKVSKNELKFFVKDTGIGIKKERLKAVFERFIQADINITKGYEGSGLGLAISSSYVEMLGGKIWVESEENKGSTFYFTLPMDNGRKNGEQADSLEKKLKGDIGTRGTPKRLKILITEDDEVSSVFLETLLQGINCEVLKSSTGAEAVYLCKHNPDIDIILMDIKLPDMNGYDATRKIREFNNKVKIIAQTAFAFSEDEAIAIKAGCNEYIKKPIKKDVLFRVIEKYRENE